MNPYITYEKILVDQLNSLKVTNRPIILFGTLLPSKIAKTALEFLNIKIACYIDNDKSKYGSNIDGIKIITPDEAKEKYPNAIIFICSFNKENIESMCLQLDKLGMTNVYNLDVLYYAYQTSGLNRKIDPAVYATTLDTLNNRENKLVINALNLAIGEKCTLNCKGCSCVVPYFKNPINYDKNKIIEGIKVFSECVDAIDTIFLVDGEPLLHPDLEEICREVSKLSNVKQLSIITNGTLIPKDSVLEGFKDTVTYISISDYGSLSPKKDELVLLATKNNIPIETAKKHWLDFGNLQKQENLHEVNSKCAKYVSQAVKDTCIIEGDCYICVRSAYGTRLGAIPKMPGDYVELLNDSYTKQEKRIQLEKLFWNTEYIKACDYCKFGLAEPIETAVQVKSKLDY